MYHPPFAPLITVHRVASKSGTLRAQVITPPMLSDLPPLLVRTAVQKFATEVAGI
ncbi:MAG: hypothetical protein U0934_11400 [Pseudotabrizicola sp.]|uniref:hypothetical protein n=1 Tax=Pseudotabrizicola sp. TaxID=2939647 RepID=UPI0027320AA2|nr:hypothetical protein [Pseudotabrizicola sp.]MDP2081128.1 hypothetical protein [Pseudotabrizicola sp.]MDZ7574546.1 hypothetical protein [Pseudotabrizicola sp.]